jgi:hypothetical protein
MAKKAERNPEFASESDEALAAKYRSAYTQANALERELSLRGYEFDRRLNPIKVFKTVTKTTEL